MTLATAKQNYAHKKGDLDRRLPGSTLQPTRSQKHKGRIRRKRRMLGNLSPLPSDFGEAPSYVAPKRNPASAGVLVATAVPLPKR